MERVAVDSRAIASMGYDPALERLEVEFKTGRIYQYDKVPRSVYEWLLRIPNKGGFVTRVLEPTYKGHEVVAQAEASLDLAEALRASLVSPTATGSGATPGANAKAPGAERAAQPPEPK